MSKVAFYLHNPSHAAVDYSSPERSNPGIGGTEYMIWLISYLLHRTDSDVEVILYANHIQQFPPQMDCRQADDMLSALVQASQAGVRLFVCPWGPHVNTELLNAAEKSHMKLILWVHNYLGDREAALIAKASCIQRVVCVGQEQYERLCDHKVFQKATYINNTISFAPYTARDCADRFDQSVCYIGSLTPAKGFLQLAEIWPEVERRVPGAQLYVMGSGQLYDKHAQLGAYGLAETSYESQFMPYLLDEAGRIKSNVHFLGVVGGTKKIELMRKMSVGVVNPTGAGETFCIGAIEFEAVGVPVVTIRKEALVDTVQDQKTGLLFDTRQQFADHIVTLLTDAERNQRLGTFARTWVREAFSTEEITAQWASAIRDVDNGVPVKPDYHLHNLKNGRKWLRQINRRIQIVCPFLPAVSWYEEHISPALAPLKAGLRRTLKR